MASMVEGGRVRGSASMGDALPSGRRGDGVAADCRAKQDQESFSLAVQLFDASANTVGIKLPNDRDRV
jgi:hypothetical protein